MNHMETIQGHIEITRQQIIGQLEEEISQFQNKLKKISSNCSDEKDRWGQRAYQTIILRKRQLISKLS